MQAPSADARHPAAVARHSHVRLLLELLERLDADGVRYCHWKGIIRLESVMAAERDVDLLVDRSTASSVVTLLGQMGSRRLVDTPGGALPGVEHHLGLDRETGKLVHLHVHFQLMPTKSNRAGYRLPWEELVLATRVRHESGGYVIDPALETVLFIVRGALRVRTRHLASAII